VWGGVWGELGGGGWGGGGGGGGRGWVGWGRVWGVGVKRGGGGLWFFSSFLGALSGGYGEGG